MATWTSLITDTARLLDDPNNVLYSTATIQKFLEHAELLMAMSRGLTETTGNLSLTSGTPVYNARSTFSDYVAPLRVTINSNTILPVKFANIAAKDSTWSLTTGVPIYYYQLGATLIGFYPTPSSNLVAVTDYLRVPPTSQPGGNSPVIPTDFHPLMPHYAASVLFGVEGDVVRAMEEMQHFLEGAGIGRDSRFLADNRQKDPPILRREIDPIPDSPPAPQAPPTR